jgi:uncharacterized protein (TIGR02268 family)
MRTTSRLHRVAAAALVTFATVAEAQQPAVVRVRREQQLVLARIPAGGEPELRLVPGIPTVVRFDAEVVHAEVTRKGSERLVWVEVVGRSVSIKSREALASGERLPLEVILVQGPTRTQLVFQLVSHPGEVDANVDVELRPRSTRPELESEVAFPLREGGLFSRMVFSGVMGELGITGRMFLGKTIGSGGVTATRPWDYRAEHGRAITFLVHNPKGAMPWVASEVVCLSPTGEVREGSVRWVVSMVAPIEPGRSGQVVVESTEAGASAPVLLEVREAGGSRSVRVEESR